MTEASQSETGELDPTATYSSRSWGWQPTWGIDGNGLLTIAVKSRHLETSQYSVEELDSLPGLMGRQFRLTKIDGGKAYVVAIGGLESCTCQAGQCRAKEPSVCKHLDAMRAILARGLLGGEEIENERSGLWMLDEPGEPTVAEIEAGDSHK